MRTSREFINIKKLNRIIFSILFVFITLLGCGNKTETVTDSQGRTRLVLAIVGEDYNISQLVAEFNKSQNEYYIETTEYKRLDSSEEDDDTSVKIDDGIAQLQREIVAGNGPDIIDFGESFTTSDICGEYTENLKDYFLKENDKYNNKYYENVFDAYAYKDKWYCVPTSFYIDTVIGKTKNLDGLKSWDLDQMLKTISNKKEMSLWPNVTKAGVFTTLLIANMEQYIDWENGKSLFDSNSFRELLEYCKNLPDTPGKKVYQDEFVNDKQLLYYINTGSVYEMTTIKTLFGDDDLTIIGYPTENGSGTKVQTGATVLGISSSSKQKEGSFKFIEFVLSDDIQKSFDDGFPVNREVTTELINEALAEEYIENSDGKKELCIKDTIDVNEDQFINIYKISEEDADDMKLLLDSDFCSCNIDWNLYFAILDEAYSYFDGNQDIDKTISNIQSRASIYVAEKGM